jgi:hypothetical protein
VDWNAWPRIAMVIRNEASIQRQLWRTCVSSNFLFKGEKERRIRNERKKTEKNTGRT